MRLLLTFLSLHPSLDPLTTLPLAAQRQLACVRHVEDPTGVLVDGDASSGHEGLYQFALWLWSWARGYVIDTPPTPNQASRIQQDRVAYFFYVRNGGLKPEWTECS
jgi:hypothetical protein